MGPGHNMSDSTLLLGLRFSSHSSHSLGFTQSKVHVRHIAIISMVGCSIMMLAFVARSLPTKYILQHLLHVVAVIVGLILFINIRSLPLVYHINVFLPGAIGRCKYYILSFFHLILLRPPTTRHRTVISQLESCCPVGANPFEFTTVSRSWASPDETDWFGHVNNGTYPKARDSALRKFGLAGWPTFVNAGGVIALSSTHYRFVREIPRFARYEMEMSIRAWDHKWFYLVCLFKSPSPTSRNQFPPSKQEHPPVTTGSDSNPSTHRNGSTLYCVNVSRLCFKMGRITVPPAIVMACEGFSKPPKSGSYSLHSPPPHWIHPHTLRSASDNLGVYRRFLAGGWRDVPEKDRWWVEPLSGPIEEQRRFNLVKLEAIDKGMDACTSI